MEKENLVVEPKKKNKKPLPKWVSLTITIGVCLTCCGAGIATGIILHNFLSYESVDYTALNIDDYEDDIDKLITKYNKTDSSKYFSTFAPYEMATIGRYKASQHNYVKSVSIGEVHATMGVKQSLRGYFLKEGNDYFFESISKSRIVGINKRFYQDDEKVVTIYGEGTEIEKATWSEEGKEVQTIAEYEEKWGRNLSRCSNFIISSKTTLMDQTSMKKEGNDIVLSLELDPLTSVLRYVKNMKAMSDLDDYPVFHKMHIDMKLDSQLNIKWVKTEETYDVKSFGITSKNTFGSAEETFTYDQKEEIPDLNTDCVYTKGE